jgi:hypothetical protein
MIKPRLISDVDAINSYRFCKYSIVFGAQKYRKMGFVAFLTLLNMGIEKLNKRIWFGFEIGKAVVR